MYFAGELCDRIPVIPALKVGHVIEASVQVMEEVAPESDLVHGRRRRPRRRLRISLLNDRTQSLSHNDSHLHNFRANDSMVAVVVVIVASVRFSHARGLLVSVEQPDRKLGICDA